MTQSDNYLNIIVINPFKVNLIIIKYIYKRRVPKKEVTFITISPKLSPMRCR
jgi:hypothetical protein